ncbi:hypothetical protein Agub_g14939, partial [Astrephomene gubernaculifera]
YDDVRALPVDEEAARLLSRCWPRMHDVYVLGAVALHHHPRRRTPHGQLRAPPSNPVQNPSPSQQQQQQHQQQEPQQALPMTSGLAACAHATRPDPTPSGA